jgi:hypothetical protein
LTQARTTAYSCKTPYKTGTSAATLVF